MSRVAQLRQAVLSCATRPARRVGQEPTRLELYQQHLRETGRYAGQPDNAWGRLSEAGTLLLLTDGPDTPITDADLHAFAAENELTFGQVKALLKVEANGAGFFQGRPLILPEPHRFSKATKRRFDKSHPSLSYPTWGSRPYPKSQDARYTQLLGMIKLDVDAGFGSASYGKPQIMGENHVAAGFETSWLFAESMAKDEPSQLRALGAFLRSTGLLAKLRRCTTNPETCRAFCEGYNGTGYRKNNYHVKLAQAIAQYS